MNDRASIALGISLWAVAAVAVAQTAPEGDAQGSWRAEFVTTNSAAAVKAAYPPSAYTQKISGEVTLACIVGTGGTLTECKVSSEDPEGYGFGDAALKLVLKERVKVKDAAGQSVIGRPIKSYFPFLAPGDANAKWIRKPTSDNLAAVFPRAALQQGKDGRAVLMCAVTVEGFLQNCKVNSETPEGLGFGEAGLLLTSQFRLSPKIRNGRPVATDKILIPINWEGMPYVTEGYKDYSRSVLRDPPWVSTPTWADVKAAWPARANVAVGQVALRCEVKPDGFLKGCEVVNEKPGTLGLGRAAVRLSSLFKVRLEEGEAKKVGDFVVDIPFRFRNPAEPDTRKVTAPTWISMISDDSVALIYPKAALEAGVMKGLGVLGCTIEASGALKDCQVQRESPEGLGFGTAALAASKYMIVNPWSVEGDPYEGLRINVPLQLVFPETAASEAKAP